MGGSLLVQAEALSRFPHRGGNVRQRPGIKKIIATALPIFYRVDDEQHSVDVLRF